MKLTMQDIYDAKERLSGTVHKTSLYPSGTFSAITGAKIYLKSENLQKTGSFKVRGAYNKIAKLSERGKIDTVVAASAGNHAQGVAYAAAERGIEAIIVMPKGTPIAKVLATENYGARAVLYGECYDDAYNYALEIAREKNACFIHPFNDEDVIAGQATVALEILEEKPDIDMIIVPAGGGGLLAGVAFYAAEFSKKTGKKIEVVGVQAEKADAIAQSYKNKKLTPLNNVFTIADGIAVKNPGELTFEYIKKYADNVLTVTDDQIAETIIHLLERNKTVVEPAGATPLALALSGKLAIKNKKVACVMSGGNIDVGLMHKIIEKGLVSRGRQAKLSVVLPDKPGALERFANIMGNENANIISVQYDRTSTELSLNETILHIEFEAAGKEHGKRVTEALKKAGYVLL